MATSPTMPGTPDLSLCCWIRGEPFHAWHTFEVPPDTTIKMLKELLIKQSESYTVSRCLPADLKAHKIPEDRPVRRDNFLRDNLGRLSISMLGSSLRDESVVSDIFTPLPEKHLHLIVDTPFPEIGYWFRGAKPDEDDFCRIQPHDSITAFKERVRGNDSCICDLPTGCIKVYKILEDDLEESLAQLDKGELLDGTRTVSDCFADIPVLEPYCVIIQLSYPDTPTEIQCSPGGRITIDKTDPIQAARSKFLESYFPQAPSEIQCSPGRRVMIDKTDPIQVARYKFLESCPPQAPSDSSHPSSPRAMQRGLAKQTLCIRPCDPEETIPATLLHPVFGQFLDDCKTHPVTAEDNAFVGYLAHAMSQIYDDKEERLKRVNAELATYGIGLRVGTKKGSKYQADADLAVGEYRCVIAEVRNELASLAPGPSSHYLEQTRIHALENTNSPLPCFLLVLAGPLIFFSGAVWNLRPAVQVLSTPIPLNYHSMDTDNQVVVARHMAAFRKAIRSLQKYYEDLSSGRLSNTKPNPPCAMLFPYPTSFKSLAEDSEEQLRFRYTEQVKDDDKRVFFGTLENSDVPICVKFVRRYSREAHLRCARAGFAPALRGFESIPGGWLMVVMDKLVGYHPLCNSVNPLPKSSFEDIRTWLNELHSDGFVHGDVRDVNIMVKRRAGTIEFKIIDFDWAGEINVVRYPPYVNRKDVDRPDGAQDGELVLAAHDDWMLEELIASNGV